MRKVIIASALVAFFASNSSFAGKDNGFSSHPQYPQLSLVNVELPSVPDNADIVDFFKWLNKNSVPIKIIKMVEMNSITSVDGIVQDQKVKFKIDTKHAKNAKMKVLDGIYIKNTKEGFILLCNDVPIAVVSNYAGNENFKQK